MKPSISAKLTQLTHRLDELNALLASQDATSDMDNYRRLSREHSELGPVVDLYRSYRSAEGDLKTAQEMAQDPQSRE
jgi:peptide chain release factor 1